MENREILAQKLIEFLKTRIVGDPSARIDAETPLVSSGMVDSFALVDILMELERVTNCRIPSGRVSPDRLDTVNRMLETAELLGTPKPSG